MTKRTWLMVAGMVIVAVAAVWIWDANRVKPLGTKRVDLGNGVTMDFVWIPPGEFMMGSPTNEVGRSDDATQHRVKISKGFWMGKYEVTQEQYKAVMGVNPSQEIVSGRYPVNNVSWDDAVTFCAKVKVRTGLELRLPTNAEWEYACRAGTTTAYYTGDTEADLARAGSYFGNSLRGFKLWKWDRRRYEPRSVGCFEPNAWGLYDMHGNIWELCADYYSPLQLPTEIVVDPVGPENDPDRTLRGGSWLRRDQDCRSAIGFRIPKTNRFYQIGFRCHLSR